MPNEDESFVEATQEKPEKIENLFFRERSDRIHARAKILVQDGYLRVLCSSLAVERSRTKDAMNEVIRVRAGVAVIQDGKIVLVPHYQTDPVAIRWYVPGGGVEFGESLHNAAVREFEEETGLSVHLEHLLDVSEVLEPERPWHSITVIFFATITGGVLRAESHAASAGHGDKTPRWFSLEELQRIDYRPRSAIQAAFALASDASERKQRSIDRTSSL